MKKINLFAISALSCGLALVSCGAPTGDQILSNLAASAITGNTNTASPQTATTNSNGTSILGSILSGATGNDTGSLLTGVIGALIGNNVQSSIVGTWVYSGPSVEFESSNLLAQAGGLVASNQLKTKISPYYEKLGIKPGAVVMQFNADNTCVIQVSGKTQTANYVYDSAAHTLKITGQNLGLSFGTAYATVSPTQLSLTFDSSKLLSTAQTIATASKNSTLTSISDLSKSFNGMKTGFLFVKQ